MTRKIDAQKGVLEDNNARKEPQGSIQRCQTNITHVLKTLFGSETGVLSISDKTTACNKLTEDVVGLRKSKSFFGERERTVSDSGKPAIFLNMGTLLILWIWLIETARQLLSSLPYKDFVRRQRWSESSICNHFVIKAVIIFLNICVSSGMNINITPSSSLHKMVYVPSCPKNKSEWMIAAANKNCSKENGLEYHCLINENLSTMVEICDISKIINGQMCAEYNTHGKRIQASLTTEASCRNFTTPCKMHYRSSEAYMYQECYDLVKYEEKSEVSPELSRPSPVTEKLSKGGQTANNRSANEVSVINSSKMNNRSSSDVEDTNSAIYTVAVVIPVCLLIAVLVVVYRCQKREDKCLYGY